MLLPRRTALGLGASLCIAKPSLVRATSLDQGTSCFPFGVASGDPDTDSVVIWTRLGTLPLVFGAEPDLPEAVPVIWEIALNPDMTGLVASGHTIARKEAGYSIHVVPRLPAAGRPYWYRFLARGCASPVGRTVSLPRRSQRIDSLRLGIASCAHYEFGYYAAYDRMADDRPDLVAFLGDYIYEHNAPPRRLHEAIRAYGAPLAYSLADYRWRYAIQKTDTALQRAHRVAPWLCIWDDHEVEDDYSGLFSAAKNETQPAFAARRAAAYQAWFENMPVRPELRRNRNVYQLYRRLYYGDLASIDLLDGRQYRSQQPCPTGKYGGEGHMEADSCRDLFDPGRSFLGRDQELWLHRQLKEHHTLWTILAQDLMVASLRAPDHEPGHYRYWTDSWDGFQSARNRLMDLLADTKAPSPVIFSGDYHAHFASEIRQRAHDPRSPVIATEFLGTSITSPGPSFEAITSVLPLNPDIHYYDSRQRGYILADFRRDRAEIALKGLDNVRDPLSAVQDMARFIIKHGEMKLVKG
ncbi:alkaline phosphatase D family protein [Asaia lannensis]|uniref:Alkaline phosphatase D family protein n=1 Tax=Asaia lannensis NBRC 102526 TaxID=1307926 RepID=A0ABT1CD03_9PROT|nr:alkaline phosphatase D family protein [Asaia lannensis]MCO6158735.1 alkaline phosphatase D family protein [Asaia lannensis NBRC 102526]GBR00351.1 alkaline phosphatase D [Asaia lannensis NBRC 102526]